MATSGHNDLNNTPGTEFIYDKKISGHKRYA